MQTVWRSDTPTRAVGELPPLRHGNVCLREVRVGDASDLAALFADTQVSAHLSLVPSNTEAFVDWVHLSHARRGEGRAACYVVQVGPDVSGLFIASRLSAAADTAEVGFVLAPPLWGSGVFLTASTLFVSSLFERWRLTGLTARTLVRNHRGIGAMRKLGAKVVDQTMRGTGDEFVWIIGRDEWLRAHG